MKNFSKKKCVPKLLNENEIRKIPIILDIKIDLESQILAPFEKSSLLTKKNFPLNMLIFARSPLKPILCELTTYRSQLKAL